MSQTIDGPLLPYADLTPDVVLDAMASVGLFPDGRLMALNSYENRVFQVGLDDGLMVVAKFYRPVRWSDEQILEEHAFAQELSEADIPVVAPMAIGGQTLLKWATADHASLFRFSISPRRGGRAPELDDPDTLQWLGRLLARLHAVGRRQPFAHRETLSPQLLGWKARDWLATHGDIPEPQRTIWLSVVEQALQTVERCFEQVPQLGVGRIHGDCHPGNVLWTPDGPHFVDLDDACNGPAVQDLWMLLGGPRHERQVALHALMEGYESMHDFDWREWKLVEALRTLRLIHHSAWLARRWSDPAFPPAFPWFGGAMYWQQQSDQLRQQIEAMQTDLAQDW